MHYYCNTNVTVELNVLETDIYKQIFPKNLNLTDGLHTYPYVILQGAQHSSHIRILWHDASHDQAYDGQT